MTGRRASLARLLIGQTRRVPSKPVPRTDYDVDLSQGVTVLKGELQGKYPTSNSMQVTGSLGSLLIDPSIDVFAREGAPASIDRVLVSHAHEDHLAGIARFPDASVCAHHHDVHALRSLDGLLDVYGMPEPIRTTWGQQLLSDFHYTARADAAGFDDGDVFDLGGRTVTVIHLPGHTRGHCGFLVEPDGAFFVADIDLTSFGPYYGDHWSDLEDFERAIDRAADVDARWYVTSHHKGVIEGRDGFVSALASFKAVIAARESRLLAFLSEPRSLSEIVEHRIVYRPGTTGVLWIDHVEQTSATMHLRRLQRDGGVVELESGRFRAA
jgi:glyoxylase-like metal-dependent hydrolase (beta-lactamase superfamily II)